MPEPTSGKTPNEAGKIYRVSPDKIRDWIRSGELGAINLSGTKSGKPRYLILPHHLEKFERTRAVTPAVKPVVRRKRTVGKDYFPD